MISSAKEALGRIVPELLTIAGRPPSTNGAFADVEDLPTILSNIGGNDDHNAKITRRVLFLLEGDWLNNRPFFQECRQQLLGRYIRDTITSHQLALFLLNDIIRYYRTVCVDFEFKTIEHDKPWGTRNIKLVFSRKLLYFSGVLVVAETMQRSYKEKVRIAAFIGYNPGNDHILVHTGDSGQGLTHGVVGSLLLSRLIAGDGCPWADFYAPSRVTLAAAKNFVAENVTAVKNFAEYLAPGELASIEDLVRSSAKGGARLRLIAMKMADSTASRRLAHM
jgi:hypothetical protein